MGSCRGLPAEAGNATGESQFNAAPLRYVGGYDQLHRCSFLCSPAFPNRKPQPEPP
jgi:hypothetical protein